MCAYRHCDAPVTGRQRVYCSVPCRRLEWIERAREQRARSAKAADFMNRVGPDLARGLALTMWPDLRTPKEQAAVDQYLAKTTAGLVDALRR